MLRVAQGVVALAGCYLVALGVLAAVRPQRAKQYLEAHVRTWQAHAFELALRAAAGAALVVAGPGMRGATVVRLAGWILMGTTLVLAVLPWRWHQRFAAWSVPQATRSLPLVALGALTGGVLVVAALVGGARGL